MMRKRKMTPRAQPKPQRFDPKVIAARVRTAREAHDMTAKELAAAIGIGKDALFKKEKAENPFYLDELSRIADALNAPSLWPFLEWDAAGLADKLLGRG